MGSKSDREGAEMGSAEAAALARELAIDGVAPRVSALTGEGVRYAFVTLARACLRQRYGAGAVPSCPEDGEWVRSDNIAWHCHVRRCIWQELEWELLLCG
jgi:hypothetical protein